VRATFSILSCALADKPSLSNAFLRAKLDSLSSLQYLVINFDVNEVPNSFGNVLGVNIHYYNTQGDNYTSLSSSNNAIYSIYLDSDDIQGFTGFEIQLEQNTNSNWRNSTWIGISPSIGQIYQPHFVDSYINYNDGSGDRWMSTLDLSSIKTVQFDGTQLSGWNTYWLRVNLYFGSSSTPIKYNLQGSDESSSDNAILSKIYSISFVPEINLTKMEIYYSRYEGGTHKHLKSKEIYWVDLVANQNNLITKIDKWDNATWDYSINIGSQNLMILTIDRAVLNILSSWDPGTYWLRVDANYLDGKASTINLIGVDDKGSDNIIKNYSGVGFKLYFNNQVSNYKIWFCQNGNHYSSANSMSVTLGTNKTITSIDTSNWPNVVWS
jgi:hypothetical protein